MALFFDSGKLLAKPCFVVSLCVPNELYINVKDKWNGKSVGRLKCSETFRFRLAKLFQIIKNHKANIRIELLLYYVYSIFNIAVITKEKKSSQKASATSLR